MSAPSLEDLIAAIRGFRIRTSTEEQAQADVEAVLTRRGIPFEAQKVLSPRDRIDVFCGGVAVEIKVKGSRPTILRQLERYAALPQVTGVLLVSGIAWPFQGEIGGKPFRAVQIGAGWL